MYNEYKDASSFVEVIRSIIRQELENKDQTAICVVESANQDGTLNLYVLPDRQNVIKNVVNQCRFNFGPGDTALLFKVDNRLSNSFVVAKYNAKMTDVAWTPELDSLYEAINEVNIAAENAATMTDDEYTDLLGRINALRFALNTLQVDLSVIERKVANVAIVEDE